MAQSMFIFLLMVFPLIQLHAQEKNRYFPTGMKWKEIKVVPFSSSPLDTTYSVHYEIGEDTLVGNRPCKTILKDGKPLGQWITEEGERVWIIREADPSPIMIYDFNWNDGKACNEYLKIHEDFSGTGGISYQTELVRSYLNLNNVGVTFCHNGTVEYLLDSDGCVIRHIGRVSDLNRESSLLGYRIYDPVLPGVEYTKVLWVVRNGIVIFRSEKAGEWILSVPDIVDDIPVLDNVNNAGASHKYVLYQITPNTFGASTSIMYSIPHDATNAQIIIFDMQGMMLSKIPICPSNDRVILNGTEFPVGMYLYTLAVNGKKMETKRMIITR